MIFTESYRSPDGKEYRGTREEVTSAIAADLAAHPGETWDLPAHLLPDVRAALRLLCRHPLPGAEPPPHVHRHLARLLLVGDPMEGIDAVNSFVRDHPGEWEIVGMRASLTLSPEGAESYYHRALTLWAAPHGVNVSITRGGIAAADDGEYARPDGLLSKIAHVAADALARPGYADLSAHHLPPWLRAPVRAVLRSRSEGLRHLAESIQETA